MGRASALAACMNVAAEQYGIISARQARENGVSADAIHRLVLAGSIRRVLPAVYALWVPQNAGELWLHRLAAGAAWLGDGSAISHRAGAALHGLDGVDSPPAEFCAIGRRRRSDGSMIVHRTKWLRPDEVVRIGRLPVTSVRRTLLDLGAVAGRKSVELALESALRRRLVTVSKLFEAVHRSPRTHKGRGVLRAILESHPGRATESAFETMLWQALKGEGVPLPVRQHDARDEFGRLVARLDFAYADARLALEAEGHEFHSSRHQLRRDRLRQNALAAIGWTVYRVGWEELAREPRKVAVAIRSLLEARMSR